MANFSRDTIERHPAMIEIDQTEFILSFGTLWRISRAREVTLG